MRLMAAFGMLSFMLTPASPARAAPDLSAYGQLPVFERAVIAPSGERTALVGTIKGQRMLVVLGAGNAAVISRNIPQDRKVVRVLWAGDDTVLLETSNTEQLSPDYTAAKVELHAMTVIPLGGGDPWTVFEKSELIDGGIRGFYGVSQRDGKWYGYFSAVTLDYNRAIGLSQAQLTSTHPVLYEVDLANHHNHKIADRIDGAHDFRDWLVGADGKVGVTLDYFSSSGSWAISTARKSRVVSGVQMLGGVELIGFGSSPDSFVYRIEDAETGERHLLEMPLAGGEATEIPAQDGSDSALRDHFTRKLVGYALVGDAPAYHFVDPHRDRVIAAAQKAFPGLSVHLADWNEAFDRLIVLTEGANDAGTWWVIDVKSGKAAPIGSSYAIAPADVAPVRMIHYKAQDGTEIAGVLTLPPGRVGKNLPLVVFPHGGPASRDYPDFNWWAQAFASRGYAVFQPNFRGSTGYGPGFERAGHGEWGRKMQTDVSDGLAQLVKDGIADPKRACIMGASYGGYAALAGVTLQHGLYRCAVSVAGVSDVEKMVQTDQTISGYNPAVRRALTDAVGAGRDLGQVSPIRFAAEADAPILLIHGKDDTVVLFDQSASMASALTRAKKPVEFVTLPQTDHWLTKGATRLAMLNAAVAFVEKYNPPGTAPK